MTQGGYPLAVGDRGDLRAEQKARTRERIRATAQAMFAGQGYEAVTIVQVAAGARVSVQTVFNHFSGKEDLFFAGRTQWVDGPARAVRGRAPGEGATAALRRHFAAMVAGYAREAGAAEHRALVEVLTGSPALLAHERSLHEAAVADLAGALAEAWDCTGGRAVRARVTAAVWLGAVRAILLDLRGTPPAPGDDEAVRAAVELTERVLGDLDAGLSIAGRDGRRAA